MKEIIKVLLQEGIDEGMINKVLDLIEEEYDVVEGQHLMQKVFKEFEKGNINASKAQELATKALSVPSSNDIYTKEDPEKGTVMVKDGEGKATPAHIKGYLKTAKEQHSNNIKRRHTNDGYQKFTKKAGAQYQKTIDKLSPEERTL